MSQQTPDDPDRPDARSPEKDTAKLELSWPKIFGGALAAVTTAVLGSQLGVAGTIVGAALASVVGAVAGSLYTVGLDRTHRTFTSAVRRGVQRVRGQKIEPEASATAAIGLAEPAGPDATTARTRSRVLRNALAATGAILAVSLLTITVFELVIGRSLNGSEGTTVSQVVEPRATRSATKSASPSATPTPTPTPTSAVPTPTAVTPTVVTPTAASATSTTTTTTAPPTTTAPVQTTTPVPTTQPSAAQTSKTTAPAPTQSG